MAAKEPGETQNDTHPPEYFSATFAETADTDSQKSDVCCEIDWTLDGTITDGVQGNITNHVGLGYNNHDNCFFYKTKHF